MDVNSKHHKVVAWVIYSAVFLVADQIIAAVSVELVVLADY